MGRFAMKVGWLWKSVACCWLTITWRHFVINFLSTVLFSIYSNVKLMDYQVLGCNRQPVQMLAFNPQDWLGAAALCFLPACAKSYGDHVPYEPGCKSGSQYFALSSAFSLSMSEADASSWTEAHPAEVTRVSKITVKPGKLLIVSFILPKKGPTHEALALVVLMASWVGWSFWEFFIKLMERRII